MPRTTCPRSFASAILRCKPIFSLQKNLKSMMYSGISESTPTFTCHGELAIALKTSEKVSIENPLSLYAAFEYMVCEYYRNKEGDWQWEKNINL